MDASERIENLRDLMAAADDDSMGELYMLLARHIKDATTQEEACMLLGELMSTISTASAAIAAMHELVHDDSVTLEDIQNNVEGAMADNAIMTALVRALKAGDMDRASEIVAEINDASIDKLVGEIDPDDLNRLLADLGVSVEVTDEHPDPSENAA